MRARVRTHGGWSKGMTSSRAAAGAVVLDLDCRDDSAVIVSRKIHRAVRLLSPRCGSQWYHKIDSGLRGTIGAQIIALMRALEVRTAIMAPANPAYGRSTRRGIHYIEGAPLARSALRSDPTWPRRISRIARVVGDLPGIRVRSVYLDHVRRGSRHLRTLLNGMSNCPTLAIVDAETGNDLRAIARAVSEFPLVVGSAGLARYLATFGRSSAESPARPRLPSGLPHGTLIVAGSAAPATLRQNEAAMRWIGGDVRLIAPPRRRGRAASVRTALLREMRRHLAGAGRIIVSGGRTASDVCAALGVEELHVIRPLAPGIGVALARGRRDLLMVLKPGSFGAPDFYRKAYRAMTNAD